VKSEEPARGMFWTSQMVIAVGFLCLPGFVPVVAAQELAPTTATPCVESLPDLYSRVSPAIVLIQTTSIDPVNPDHRLQHEEGSGVIIDRAGLILTNSHVVAGRAVITVTLDDGTTLSASLVGADPLFDVALIRIPTPTVGTLPSGDLGDSGKVQVGEEVYAIGNPLGLSQTLTRGIVSAVNRLIPGNPWSPTEPLIQTDAAINPGNSGGPLLDRCGKIIGITTAVMPDGQGLGFAIPSNLIASVIPPLLASGRMIRPWIGLEGQFVPQDLQSLLRVPLADGFLVEGVAPGSPADVAGVRDGDFEITVGGEPILLGGDIITAVDGTRLDSRATLERALASLKVGSRVKLTVFREGEERQLEVAVVERPRTSVDPTEATAPSAVGLRATSMAVAGRPASPAHARVVF
jgi:serine protease Do